LKIEAIARYPVKGLGPEYLTRAALAANGTFSFDRVFAIAHGSTQFDSEEPEFLGKSHFLMLMKNPRLAAIELKYSGDSGRLVLRTPDGGQFDGDPGDSADRQALEALLDEFIGNESRGGPPRLVSAKGHRFFDMDANYVSLLNLASVEAVGKALNVAVDPLRFRANLQVSGLEPWAERDLVGAELASGDVRFRVAAPITRCKAICANPDTAEYDLDIPYELTRRFGGNRMGLYLEVVEGGEIGVGDSISPNARG
jgi:hypothetical protein